MKKIFSLILSLALLLCGAACGPSSPSVTAAPGSLPAASGSASAEPVTDTAQTVTVPTPQTDTSTATAAAAGADDMFSDRDFEIGYSDYMSIYLADNATSSDGDVIISGNTVTITGEGTYLLTGTLSNGQILIDAPDSEKIQLVLAGADITCQNSAALYIRQADKVFLTLAPGSQNRLSSTGEFIQTDDNNVDAAIFSKVDLTMNGSGTLTVSCDTAHGIVSKDDIKITSGSYVVTAAAKGIDGKDSIRIAGGDITVTSGTDGLQSEHEDLVKGFVYLSGGSLNITSGNDGIQASGGLTIRDGSVTITAGGGYANGAAHTESFGGRGWQAASTEAAADTTETVSDSFKGLKCDAAILLSGGSFLLDCADDAIHSNTDVRIEGGSFSIQTGDDAVHADNALTISGGTLDIPLCYEGIEGTDILITGGYINIVSTDDGLNAAGGNDGSGFGGMGQDRFSMASGSLSITGGELHLNTEGDSLDANGTLSVSGGAVYISGPSWTGNGILDSDGSLSVSGGVVAATGVTGMQQNFGASSTQGSILVNLSATQAAGSGVSLYDENGQLLAQFSPDKDYSTVLVSAPGIVVGGTYTLTAGSETQSIAMTSLLYGSGGFGGMGGRGGGRR